MNPIPDTIVLPAGETDTTYCPEHGTYFCDEGCVLILEPDPYWHRHES